MIKLTGLWKGQTKDGEPMLSGTLVGAKVVILPNKFKREDKHPDYNLLITEKEEQGDHKALAQPQEDPAF